MDFSETDQQISMLEEAVARITASHSPHAVPGGIRTAIAKATANVASNIMDAKHIRAGEESVSTLQVVHYTKVETAIHLLENTNDAEGKYAHLRMYASATFNDPDEGLYLYRSSIGLNRAESLGLVPPARRPGEENISRLAREVRELFPPQRPFIEENYAYIASFVTPRDPRDILKAADNLPLWRSYGNDGDGVSLVVTIPESDLRKVRYGEDEASETAAIIAEYCQRILVPIQKLGNEAAEQEAKRVIREQLQLISYLYKSEAYDYEGESRIVVLPEGDNGTVNQHTEYRNGQFRAYHKHNHLSTSHEDGIFRSGSGIIVGPRVRRQSDAQKHIANLAERAGLQHTWVRSSTIPYRGSDSR